MDVNGTRYHLVEGPRDWLPALAADPAPPSERVVWDARRHTVNLRHELFLIPSRQSEEILTPDDRRGAGCDRFGHVYWIGPGRDEIRYRPAESSEAATFWRAGELTGDPAAACHPAAGCAPPPDRTPCGAFGPLPSEAPDAPPPVLSGLAVTDHHYLVVGTLEPGGLLLFDLHGGGAPTWMRWPAAVPFAPFDLAPVCGGGLWVLDRQAAGTARLWRLDRDLRVARVGGEATLPVPAAPIFRDDPRSPGPAEDAETCAAPPDRFPTGISLASAEALASPPLGSSEAEVVAVTALPDGTALLLQADPGDGDSRLLRWGLGGPLGEPMSLVEALRDLVDEPFTLVGHDLTFRSDPAPAPGELTGVVHVAASQGNQSFGFALTTGTEGTPEAAVLGVGALDSYLPMRRYSGKALIEGPDASYYDLDEIWLPLTEVPRPRYATSGRLDGLGLPGRPFDGQGGDRRPFDGKEPGCVWHRLFLDACIPAGDEVVVESRAADSESELTRAPWRREPRLHRRATGPERPFARDRRRRPSGEGVGTWELLFQHAKGRFLELRLTLRGSGRSTPRIGSLRVYYPRFSYLERYLPAAYREEPTSASFLDRYLANLEGFFTELEGRVAGAETLFDTRTAPAEALDWLATWLGASLDEEWDERRRRLFLAHAVELYRRRGTPRGLVEAVRLAIDPCPDESLFADEGEGARAPFGVRLVEAHRARRLPPALLGDPRVPIAPSRVTAGEPWVPAHGGAALHRRYGDFLRLRHGAGERGAAVDDPVREAEALERLNTAWGRSGVDAVASFESARFSPLPPDSTGGTPGEAADWRAFAAGGLGFRYPEIGPGDAASWRAFLRQRHRRIEALNQAWGLAGDRAHGSFDAVPLPDRLPADGAALGDWFAWATLALPVAQNAHRFTVLVPVGADLPADARRRRLDKVRAVVERERPAHTAFDVQLYWALFRIGAARVGHDTAVGEGSRFTSIVLGAGHLGEGLLAAAPPWTVRDRRVLGSGRIDPAGASPLS